MTCGQLPIRNYALSVTNCLLSRLALIPQFNGFPWFLDGSFVRMLQLLLALGIA
jgi:hypothetical protein